MRLLDVQNPTCDTDLNRSQTLSGSLDGEQNGVDCQDEEDGQGTQCYERILFVLFVHRDDLLRKSFG